MGALDDYPVIDEATLFQSGLHSLLVREQLKDTETYIYIYEIILFQTKIKLVTLVILIHN